MKAKQFAVAIGWLVGGLLLAGLLAAVRPSIVAPLVITTPQCGGLPPVAHRFDLDANRRELDSLATLLVGQWQEDLPTYKPAESAKRHDARVQAVYETYTAARNDAYGAARCVVESSKKCASTVGESNTCAMVVHAPENTYFDSPLKTTGEGHRPGKFPTKSPDGSKVFYTIGKTGRGSNTGGFSTTVGFKPEFRKSLVDDDMRQIVAYFGPRVVINTNSTGGQ